MTSTKHARTAAPAQASLFNDDPPEAALATLDETSAPEVDPRQITIFSLLDDEFPASATAPMSASQSAAAMSADKPQSTAAITRLEDQFAALPTAWHELLSPFIASDAYAPLCRFVDDERAAGKTVYPADVFRALRLTSPDEVKVVILGQDPYHGDDRGTPQAHGLAFSVPPAVRTPPSLRNIFKEIAASLGIDAPAHGCLDAWARQGVLLLNTVLTVERANAASHAKRGWERCTDTLIHEIATRHEHLVFMLWGAHAQNKRALLGSGEHCVLEAPHPSPLSAHRGFLGCGHFAQANEYLAAHGRPSIDWRLPDKAEVLA
ncbi:uracil-DNA glycosylase [Paraburkholderia tagetis]|uniref:Uracil-DNA glycosylase n=1 Tax=Paraburkholderia tagetis TaxID=2913261 RepID=A0A9X1UNB7_9BURK|nr:uracil-DNA glycosylase [Paraburkholderia tagetis]MCG5078549.1 uracil-DNA glycosylase [Paraburkholderia tagetis]